MALATFPDPILDAFAAVVRRRGREPLVASPSRRWTADEIESGAQALAERFAEEALAPGRLVGLAAPGPPAFLVGYLALRRLALVPVLCDSAQPTPDRLVSLDRLGVSHFLWTSEAWPATTAWIASRRAPARDVALPPATGAVKLSSGSTGEPRGIAATAEALLADDAQLASSMGLVAEERIVAAVPLSHSYGFSSVALPALVRGSLLVLADESAPFAPLAAGRALGATFLPTVPAVLSALVRLARPPAWPESLRRTIAAGAPLAPETARAFRERWGRPVHVFYGASECGGIAYDRDGGAAERGTVGSAVDGVRLELDPESGRLRVRSAAVATAYLPEPSPELDGESFLTGDLVEWEGSELRLLGRADDVVIVRGKNVRPREVEAVLRELDGVLEACVLGVDGPEGPRSLLRAVVAAPGAGLGYREILEHCRTRLAEHKVPRGVVVVDQLPRTERGKLDRVALAALAEGS